MHRDNLSLFPSLCCHETLCAVLSQCVLFSLQFHHAPKTRRARSLNVSSELIAGINSPHVDAVFITHLRTLGLKLAFLASYQGFAAVREASGT